ncbi:hypothetical protein Ddye_018736 [Dipteronia dyeriana]|uniref:IBR domain-containing protein n=1 Tax=Dipteronia dyeriana TaxID=168575 RepID=A0AAD9UB88_9ROSI|nr:hypothetical protein Ddye_018736 [Dipteronia dyeriana]
MLNKDERDHEDIMLMKQHRTRTGRGVPIVEKKEGCKFIMCRCGTAFCYSCGIMVDIFGHQSHYCRNCKS